jgi:hypothetical protein
MNIVARALVIIAATVLVTGCATPRAEDQIRARLLSIRRAQVRLTQTMVRIETAATGERQRWRVSYDERQEWSYSKERGWLVAIVQVINPRRELLAP